MPTTSAFLSTVAASALGAFAAGAIGYRYALSRFRGERTFDRQLAWYEEATKQLLESGRKVNVAAAFASEDVPLQMRQDTLRDAIESLSALRLLEVEAEMYASTECYAALRQAVEDVGVVFTAVQRIETEDGKELDTSERKLLNICFKLLFHAASRLAADAREHLGLKPVEREMFLYDQEYRALQAEVGIVRFSERAEGLTGQSDGDPEAPRAGAA